jgi:hypothetical protein
MPEKYQKCPLCLTENNTVFCYGTNPERPYYKCSHCELIFVPDTFHLNQSAEKAIYDQHNNDPTDEGYRTFLGKLAHPVIKRLKPSAHGLDFGCGPGPTLHLLMKEAGFECENYDPIYSPDNRLLERNYDYVLSTEVFEHLRQPRRDIQRLFMMLDVNGILGIMTKLVPKDRPFDEWHYIKDPTHICFYSSKTMEFIGSEFGAQPDLLGPDVITFEKI